VPITGPVFAYVERIGHAIEGNILNDHFSQKFEGLRFQGIVFQMAAVGRDPQTEGYLFGAYLGRWFFGPTRDFDLAFPLKGYEAPARIMHFG